MTTNAARAERRITGLLSTYQCIATLAEKSLQADPRNTSRALATTRLELLDTNWTRFQSEHAALLELNCDNLADLDYFKNGVEASCQQAYEDAKVKLLIVKEHFDRVEPTGAHLADISAIGHSSTQRRALPDIQLPTFNGALHEWRSFHDLFVAMVGNNPELTAVEKMHYLRTSIQGDAAQLISNLPVSSESFVAAWDILIARYENKRMLIAAQLDRFFGMPCVTARSAKSLNTLLNTTSEVLNALTSLQVPIDSWDIILRHFIGSRLDQHLREQWELKQGASTEPASLEILRTFLRTRARALESVEAGSNTSSRSTSSSRKATTSGTSSRQTRQSYSAQVASPMMKDPIFTDDPEADRRAMIARAISATEPLRPAGSATQSCHYCAEGHFIASCPRFKRKSAKERREIAIQRRLCFNCLSPHSAVNCRVTGRCCVCEGKHHTLIHIPSTSSAASTSRTTSTKPIATSSPTEPQDHTVSSSTSCNLAASTSSPTLPVFAHVSSSSQRVQRPSVLLATSQAVISSSSGTSIRTRLLIDPGSEVSFISERAVQLLLLHRMAASLDIVGIGSQSAGRTRGAVTFKLSSIHDSTSSITVTAFILKLLTTSLPSFSSTGNHWAHLQGILLADPDFLKPGPIDVILGADCYGLLIEPDILKGRVTEPVGQRTLLGWIVLGPVNGSTSTSVRIQHASTEDDISSLLRKFWEQEEIPSDSASTPEPEASFCEHHFLTTHSRDASGRYTVRLPFKTSPTVLGDSFKAAERFLRLLQRRLSNNHNYRELYEGFLREYETLSHMTRSSMVSSSTPVYYLPHHGVFRAHSTTTKLRVVFNGSCKTSSGVSLNDILHAGPKLQQDTSDVLLWIRRHRFIFATDITKMYRQIQVHPDDWALQRILWLDSNQQIVPYDLTTVTYGLSCAPFLAIRVMKQLVEDEGHNFPMAVLPLTKGRYVDDIFGGADSTGELQEIAHQLTEMCTRGCFPLQKWSTNSKETLHPSDTSNLQSDAVVIPPEDASVKLLGLVWSPTDDQFKFTVHSSFSNTVTKRTVLSETAQLFDPLGFISPIIVMAKIFLQELWLAKLHWDDLLPPSLQNRWLRFRENLIDLSLISLPRWLQLAPSSTVELHGFSDASQLAMSAVVYLRSTSPDGSSKVTLISSKTKVAPLKRLTIPRLELSAALLLSRLLSYIQRTLELQEVPVFLWTDSSVTLTWISSHPSRWKDFVQNRVTSIQELTSHATWRFISGKDNPADCASRGLYPRQLSLHQLWWQGPRWLSHPPSQWPVTSFDTAAECHLEERPGLAFISIQRSVPAVWDLLERYSSLNRLLRITSICQRATALFKHLPNSSLATPITPGDLETAKFFWIRLIQSVYFTAELQILSRGGTLPRSNPIAALTPFIDQLGTLRVGGRLKHSSLHSETKHPPILPRASRLTTLVISDAHFRTLHGGTQTTLTFLRSSYWIPGGRAPVRSFILRCTTCARFRALHAQQLMGQLPSPRVTPSRAFLHTGVDYAGPFTIKTWRGRAAKTYKGYISVFVCFSTSAVHLELVTDYTSDAFIAAYRRFSGRRGISHTLYSDCGTNFIGADAALRELFKVGSAELSRTISSLTNLGTKWSFNPPAAPHMGGKWEAAVKSVKHHLRRVIGETALTYEEFTTLLTQVEAVLNSRPLCPLSDDSEDPSALTPAHFLIGEALTTVPEPSLTSLAESRLSRWQLLQAQLQHFWKRWSSEYLQRSLSVSKWHSPSNSIQVGSLVLLTDERLPPSKWPLARVVTLHPGSDGLTRVVTLRTASSTFKRPTSKLCLLPVHSSSTEVAEGGENV